MCLYGLPAHHTSLYLLPIASYSPSPPLSFIYLLLHSNRLLQWHRAQVKTHRLSAWWMDQCRRGKEGRVGELEEEKVTVFLESKPPVFDHGGCRYWSLRCASSLALDGRLNWTWQGIRCVWCGWRERVTPGVTWAEEVRDNYKVISCFLHDESQR